MDDQDVFDIMEGRALFRNINRLLDESAEKQRREEEKNHKRCTFTGGGDEDESTHD
jgi:hypothetical protein